MFVQVFFMDSNDFHFTVYLLLFLFFIFLHKTFLGLKWAISYIPFNLQNHAEENFCTIKITVLCKYLSITCSVIFINKNEKDVLLLEAKR